MSSPKRLATSAWIASVEATVPAERLISIGPPYEDAYQVICGALGMPAPERPFPHVNDSEEMKKGFATRVLPFTYTRGNGDW